MKTFLYQTDFLWSFFITKNIFLMPSFFYGFCAHFPADVLMSRQLLQINNNGRNIVLLSLLTAAATRLATFRPVNKTLSLPALSNKIETIKN